MESLSESFAATTLAETKPQVQGTKPQAQGNDTLDWSTCPTPQHTLKSLPCGHVDAATGVGCTKVGLKSCARCKLVSYCSKDCQTTHWKQHKLDCNGYMRSNKWRPVWAQANRVPSYTIGGAPDEGLHFGEHTLWGGMPPIDVANLGQNEQNPKKDLNIAFASSGDFRNVMKTINSLADDYTGKVDISINDPNALVACRNLTILLILGSYPDEDTAVDVAIHHWFSALVPSDYHTITSTAARSFLDHIVRGSTSFKLPDTRSTVYLSPPANSPSFSKTREAVEHICGKNLPTKEQARAAHERVRFAASRMDHRDRVMAQLRPSHRLAFQRFRENGIVLPFGAQNSHFDTANVSLFSQRAEWLQPDLADPLQGWSIPEVMKSGAEHGAQSEDIYGCLYFYLSDQLRDFRRRIRTGITTSFRITSLALTEWAVYIRDARPPHIKSDRIDVGDNMDHDRSGTKDVLALFAPLLSPGKDAAIVGYYKTWPKVQRNGRAKGADEKSMNRALGKVVLDMRREKDMTSDTMKNLALGEGFFFAVTCNADLGYDSSRPFEDYLKKQGLEEALDKTGLKLRHAHRIVPHRLGLELGDPSPTRPTFDSEETFYKKTMVGCYNWAERFVEFGWE